jgi:putative endonuclease
MPFVYVLRCADGSLYTGAARDLALRLERHRLGKASKYTRSRLPVELVYWRRLLSWSRCLREELRIKGLTRPEKEALIASRIRARAPRRAGSR